MSENRFKYPTPVSEIKLAFPGSLGDLIPTMEEIPSEFTRNKTDDARRWLGYQLTWFSQGLDTSIFTPREGIDANLAWRHLKTIQGSFEPQHQHKEAAIAWLMSLWFYLPDTEI